AELLRHPLPPAPCAAALDLRPTGGVGPHVAEATAQDARQLQPQLAGQRANLRLLVVDEIAAGLAVLPVGEAVANRPDAAADAVARVDDGDAGAEGDEIARRRQAGKP